jgi:hypothetical protein
VLSSLCGLCEESIDIFSNAQIFPTLLLDFAKREGC